MASTESIRKYVEAMYAMLPRSTMWGRLFNTPQLLFKKIAQQDPDLESPYEVLPDEQVPCDMSGTVLSRFFSIFAVRVAILDDAVYKVEGEAHPATAVDTLSEWEAFYGLPVQTGYTVAERQERLKYYTDNWRVPRSVKYLKEYASKLGGNITIVNVTDHAWLGEFGIGEFGSARFGNQVRGGVVEITINSLGAINPDYFIRLMEIQLYEATVVFWNVATGSGIVMRYEDTDPNIIMRHNLGDDNIYIAMG
jgi:uncharacterized protein YmfQ (DUF2313 family)